MGLMFRLAVGRPRESWEFWVLYQGYPNKQGVYGKAERLIAKLCFLLPRFRRRSGQSAQMCRL
jgi:hypothetical protein